MVEIRSVGNEAQADEKGHKKSSDEEIDEVATRCRGHAEKASSVHVIFNNNALDYAPHAALGLRAALEQVMAKVPRQAELF